MSNTTTTATASSSFNLDQWQNGGLASFSESCFAEYWSTLPSSIREGQTIDPYNFLDRMALGKHLISHTGGGGGEQQVWGPDFSRHWFWGYLAQMDWQRRSGRFQDPAAWKDTKDVMTLDFTQDHTISQRSWWGAMNLQFSVAVYCGAVEAGLVPKIVLVSNDDAAKLQEDKGFQKCIEHWKVFWTTHHREFLKNYSQNDDGALITLYQHLWRTHTCIIEEGVASAKELEALLPEADRNLGLGWCHMVELLAAMNWTLLSLDCLYKFGAGHLPCRRLAGPETVEYLKEHRPKEYKTIQNMNQLKDISNETMNQMCRFWGRVTFWEFQRLSMPTTLDAITHGTGLEKFLATSRIITLAVLPHSWIELGAWIGTLSLVVTVLRKG